MPLEFQNIPVLLEGLDTKSDSKLVVPGKLLELENGVFTRPGAIERRKGYDLLSREIQATGTQIDSADGVAAFGEELLEFAAGRVYSYAPATEKWLDRGALNAIQVRTQTVVRNTYAQSNPDVAISNGVRVCAWEDSRGGTRYSVQDVDTGTFFVSDASLSASGVKPRVVAFGTDILIVYALANSLFYRRLGVATPTVLSVATGIASNADTAANHFDVVVSGTRLFIAWCATGGEVWCRYLDATLTASAAFSAVGDATGCIGIFTDEANRIWIPYATSSTGSVFCLSLTYELVGLYNVLIELFVDNQTRRVCGYASGGVATVVYETLASSASVAVWSQGSPVTVSDASGAGLSIRKNTNAIALGTVGTPTEVVRSVGLASKPWTVGSLTYVTTVFASALQTTYFLIDTSTGKVHAKAFPADAGARTKPTLSAIAPVSDGVVEIAGLVSGKLRTESGHIATRLGVGMVRFDADSLERFQSTTLGNGLHIAGGIVQVYDGASIGEAGFHVFPEGVAVDAALTVDTTRLSVAVLQEGTAGLPEITSFTFPRGTRITGGQYFRLWSAAGAAFYVWFKVDGIGTDPGLAATGLLVSISSGATAAAVATAVAAVIDPRAEFAAVAASAAVTVTNSANGVTTNAVDGVGGLGVGAGFMEAGTYQAWVIYERTDAFGQVHRSAPSVGVSFEITAANGSYTITAPTLRLTRYGDVRLALYRTLKNDIAGYRVTPIASPLLNSIASDAIVVIDNADDSAIRANEVLYTTGGILENIAPPPARLLVTFKGRLVLGGLPDANTIAYSKITPRGEPVAWSDAFVMTVDQRWGEITGLGVLDDKLVIFTERAVFVVAGSGPNDTGNDNDFSEPTLVTTDAGCSNGRSVESMPSGLLFQSAKGFYLLDRGLQVQYVGTHIERYKGASVTGVSLVPNTNRVQWLIADGPALVFDYFAGQWSTFTGHEGVGCCIWQGKFVFVRANGEVLVANDEKFTDGASWYRFRVVTSWLKFAGVGGFARAQRLLILGRYAGPHKLRVRLRYDFADVYLQDEVIDPVSVFGAATWGSDPTWGAGGVWGGAYDPYEWKIVLERQKFEAISVSIEDVQASDYNEGMALTGITFRAGIKAGMQKVRSTRQT